ncbi:MAG: LysR family transcriptional regulator [Polyangiaceae bacterium]
MDSVEAVRVFLRVAELSSFTLAAENLGLPKTTVSLAVRELESRTGARLLHRTTRRVELTQDGRAFFDKARELVSNADELLSMFHRADAKLVGRLRVDMPTGVARNFVMPRLEAFLARHPHLELELSSTDRRVDIVREGFDCVVRVGGLSDSSLVARPLGHMRLVNCASPAYLARRGTPKTIEDLARHDLVLYSVVLGQRDDGFEWQAGGAVRTAPMQGRLTVNNSDAYEAACLAGLGIIQTPFVGARRHLAAGTLVEVLPQYAARPMPVHVVYAARRQLSRRLSTFMTWLAEVVADELRRAQ